MELQKIQEASKTIILTLPISNIVLVVATGRQNRTVRKQVQLELTSDGQTVTMTFLVASGLPFQMLIGCDMLRQYSAIIDLSKYKLFLKKGDIRWTTELTNSDEIQPNKTMYHIQKYRNTGEQTLNNGICDETDNEELWQEKIEEIQTFQREKTSAQLTVQQADVYKRQP